MKENNRNNEDLGIYQSNNGIHNTNSNNNVLDFKFFYVYFVLFWKYSMVTFEFACKFIFSQDLKDLNEAFSLCFMLWRAD